MKRGTPKCPEHGHQIGTTGCPQCNIQRRRLSRAEVIEAARQPVVRPAGLPDSEPHVVSAPSFDPTRPMAEQIIADLTAENARLLAATARQAETIDALHECCRLAELEADNLRIEKRTLLTGFAGYMAQARYVAFHEMIPGAAEQAVENFLDAQESK